LPDHCSNSSQCPPDTKCCTNINCGEGGECPSGLHCEPNIGERGKCCM
jgi:hypothetical protein